MGARVEDVNGGNMHKLIALLLSTGLLVGCTSTTEVTEDAAPTQSSQEVQPEETQSPEPETLPTFELSTLGVDPEVCKIPEQSTNRNSSTEIVDFTGQGPIRGKYKGMAIAFPWGPTSLSVFGELTAVLVPVDWEDAPGNDADLTYYSENIETFADFWFMASEGNLTIKTVTPDQWFRLPGSLSEYPIDEELAPQEATFDPKKQALWDAIALASDDSIDFSDADMVFPVWPTAAAGRADAHDFNHNWNAVFRTEEGDIYDVAAPNDWQVNHPEFGGPWFYWAHEMGHSLGFLHLPSEDRNYWEQFDFEEMFWRQNASVGYDIMSYPDTAVKTLGSWVRWLAGWLQDNQVTCVEADDLEDEYFQLNHLNDISGGVESLVIKLSETQVVVVESRRWDSRFDRPIVHSRDGIVAYVVDATRVSGNSQVYLSPRDITKWVDVYHWRGSEELDANMCEGDFVEVANLRIEAASLQEPADYVRVSKTDSWVDPFGPVEGTVRGEPNQISNGCVFGPGADYEYFKSLGLGS